MDEYCRPLHKLYIPTCNSSTKYCHMWTASYHNLLYPSTATARVYNPACLTCSSLVLLTISNTNLGPPQWLKYSLADPKIQNKQVKDISNFLLVIAHMIDLF